VKRKFIIVLVCLVVALVLISVQYVHTGYVGVIESGETLRLLDRGFHLRPPWKNVTFYPVRGHEIHLEGYEEGLKGKVEFDFVLVLSVCPDSIASLHKAYNGDYLERLVSPLVAEFLREHGDAPTIWSDDQQGESMAVAILHYLNSRVASHGINVFSVWSASFYVSPAP
jgi:hypothetical protein